MTHLSDEDLGLIAAIQLLLSDLPPEHRIHLIRCAFDSDLMVFRHEPALADFKDEMRNTHNMLTRAIETCDGTSGIGATVARRLNGELTAALHDLRDAAKLIGFSI